MTGLVFLFCIAALFVGVFSWENQARGEGLSLRPAGLLSWLTSGNWPAKVGAGLLTIGTGALLRYLMLNVNFPPQGKLFSGVMISAALGACASVVRTRPQRRAVYLALVGAALGVAYLTAYSAYDFFHVVDSLQALSAMFVVACGATVFAVNARAMSMAVLAMIGAYMAPAFALSDPGPVAVYGYYLLASLLVMMMVWLQGWRPLIHLSFLFSLAGGLFFGWTQKFYTPAFYPQMQPLLMLSVALHLCMPCVEPHASGQHAVTLWRRRFDVGYFLLLPLAALVLTLLIAPHVHQEGVRGLMGLALLWGLAAVGQHFRFGSGAWRYVGVALIFVLLAGLLWFDELPWFLVGVVFTCALLAMGPALGVPESLDSLLTTLAVASAAGYLLDVAFDPVTGMPFLNAVFVRDLVLVASLGLAGWRMRPRGLSMAAVFQSSAWAWLLIACARELIRLHLDNLPQLAYLTLLVASAFYAAMLSVRPPRMSVVMALGAGVFLSGYAGANGFPDWSIVPLLISGQVVFALVAGLAGQHGEEGESVAGIARSMLPVLIWPWAQAFNEHLAAPHFSVVMTWMVASALFASLQARWLLPQGRLWPNTLSPLGLMFFGGYLFFQALFHIEREPWAIGYELVTLCYLLLTVRFMPVDRAQDARFFSLATTLAVVSVALAMVLRWVGPPGVLTVFDLDRVLLPAVVSLCLAMVGAGMAWWAARTVSRRLWGLGTFLLAASAVKLVFFDFGSLGQLGNILAMMAAGGVFLGVAWLAPMPPKVDEAPATVPMPQSGVMPSRQARSSRDADQGGHAPREFPWLWILLGLVLVAMFARHHGRGPRVMLIPPPAPAQTQEPAPEVNTPNPDRT